ncbi:MAG: hypothetical protein M5U01_16805 [Ardenticatenaceae bacterium]|nr:hypothetical protein [Ardenticatenaceae bacterium]HBY97702.1 hypothetical protein [Chloroflexota bacterium]
MQPSRVFLLRAWPEGGSSLTKRTTWRFRVEEVGEAGHAQSFASLALLLAFLQTEFGADGDEPGEATVS